MKDKTFGILLIALLGLIAALVIFLPALSNAPANSQLTAGNSSKVFCSKICGSQDRLYASNNNTEFNFTRCECVTGTSDPGSRSNSVNVYKNISYFDSYNLSSLTEEQVLKKIENKS